MKPLFYILRKSLKNTVKQLVKKPLVLVFYILIAVSFIVMIISTLFLPPNITGRGSIETYGAIISGILLLVLYFGIKQGVSSGGSFFRTADVNFVFTTPISPRKVLVYGFLKQLSTTLFTILFLSFQIPNIRNNFPLKSYGIPIILLGAFMLVFSMPIIGMLIYSITSVSKRARMNVERVLNALVMLLCAGFMLTLLKTKDIWKAALSFFNSSSFYYIPFIGWLKAVFMPAVEGIDSRFYLNTGFVVAAIAIMIYVIYKLKTDYYEDVLAATERREEMIKAKKEGKSSIRLSNMKLRKAHQEYRGRGARALFYRHMLEYKKAGHFFIDRNTFVIAAVGVASSFFFPKADINTVLFFSIYLLFFFAIQGKWSQELGKPYIYLIPDSSLRKVFYATLPEVIKNLVDGIVLFGVVGFILKSDMLAIVLCGVVYMTFGVAYIYGDILSRRLFGSVHSKNLKMFTKMFLVFFLILPGIVLFVVLNVILKDVMFINYISFIVLIIYNVLASLMIMFFCKGIFEQLELY